MITGQYAVVFGQRTAAITFLFDAGIDGDGQVLPVYEVFACGVAPMLAAVFVGVLLVE